MMMIKFLLFSLLVISPIISINGDKDLMIRECDNAKVPTICMQCLESNPNSGTADAVGIAGIVIDCLRTNLVSLNEIITILLSSEKGKGDGAIKTALEDCTKDLSEAFKILPKAKEGLENREYDNAGLLVTIALDSPVKCKDNFQNVKFQSLHLFSQINIYAQLSEAASRIIDRL